MGQFKLSEQEKCLILQSISEAIFYLDLNREIQWKNPIAEEALSAWKASGQCFREVFGLEEESELCPFSEVVKSKVAYSSEREFVDGTYKLMRFFPVLDQEEECIGVAITLLDITERIRARQMNESLLEMSKFINETDSIIAVYKKAYTYLDKYFDLKLMCVAGKDYDESYVEFLSDSDKHLGRKKVLSLLESLQNIMTKNDINDSVTIENNTGHTIAYPMSGRILMLVVEYGMLDDELAIGFINTIVEQIKTGMSKIENLNKMTYQAKHDSHTGLYNREYFINKLEAQLGDQRLADNRVNYSVAVIDLNYFKEVNDTYSHIVGDHVLCVIANRIKSALRGADVVARIGGDEFALMFISYDRKEITRLIRRIQKEISIPIEIEETSVRLGSSIGIVYDVSKYVHVKKLLRDADKAMYEAKMDKSGMGHYKFYEKLVQKKIERHLTIEKLLKVTDFDASLEMMYQPIIDLNNMEVKGYEGFLRWKTDQGENYMPNEFIPIANESEEILRIGKSVISMATQAIKKMDLLGRDECFVNINLTVKQLMSKPHMDMVKKAIVGEGIASNRIKFDINDRFTQNQVRDVAKNIEELKDFGVQVNLDDFGTGSASLVTLNQIDVKEIKIDSSYIKRLRYDDKAFRMVKSIIDLAKSIGVEVLAEGVENKEDLEILKELGCDRAQGYYFSKPLPFDKALALQKGRFVN